jgi:hypothetical protein
VASLQANVYTTTINRGCFLGRHGSSTKKAKYKKANKMLSTSPDNNRLPIKKRMFVRVHKRPVSAVTQTPTRSMPSPVAAVKTRRWDNPVEYATMLLEKQNLDLASIAAAANAKFIPPTDDRMKFYIEATRVLRDTNLVGLKQLHLAGVSMDACNRFGDSLIHIACRRGMTSIVKFLVEDAKCSLYVRDDFLRTPLHDACWTPEPNFEIVETLLRVAPDLVLLRDSRGATPFDYIRVSHKPQWVEFLATHEDLLRPREQ